MIKNIALLSVILLVVLSLSWPHNAWALPPRPDPTSTPRPTKAIAKIKLSVIGATDSYYTVVQWLDALGGWHDVQGWRGRLDEYDRKLWVVERKDFGTGPFRWALYDDPGSELLATSESFFLPAGRNQCATRLVVIEP